MSLDAQIPSPDVLATLEQVARDVALACARLITEERPDGMGVHHTKSTATDAVTVMDQRSEELASSMLHERRPDDGQFGEEGLREVGTTGITWVVDPIDGTVNYLYRIPAYAVSVAAVVGDPGTEGGWRPVAAAVINAATGELFSAHLGGGSRLTVGDETHVLRCEPAHDLALTMVATGFYYSPELRRQQAEVVTRVIPQVRDIRRFGAASLDLCHVADGTVDAYYERHLSPWDVAGGWLVAEEAGATVRGLDGTLAGGAMTLAGRGEILDQLEPLVR